MRLVLESGPRAGETIEVRDEQVIGRGEVDIMIEDPKLSRRHAVVRTVEGGLEIEDLGSLNGTEVDGRRIGQPVRLHGGERIRLCSTTMSVAADEPRAQATALEEKPVPSPALAEPAPVPRAPAPRAPVAPALEPEVPLPTPPAGLSAAPAAGLPRPAASLLWGPTLLCALVIVAVAVAEVVYFATR